MARILITRHGQTKENVDGTIQGKDHGNINEKGYKQIRSLIKRLSKEKIDHIISSDIPRCKITAEEILKGIESSIEYINLIREKDNGDLVGKKHKDINWDKIGGDFETRKVSNGENLIEVRERARKFFRFCLEKFKNSDETILIISHGAFLKVLIGDLLGMSLHDSIFRLFIEHCSITELEINNKYEEGYRFKFINDISHLDQNIK